MRYKRGFASRFKFGAIYGLFGVNVFLLLLSFIAVLPRFISQTGLPIELPYVISSEPIRAQDLIISLSNDGLIYLGKKPISKAQLDKYLDRAKEIQHVLIKVDRRVSLVFLSDIWDLLRRSGVKKVYLATNV